MKEGGGWHNGQGWWEGRTDGGVAAKLPGMECTPYLERQGRNAFFQRKG